MEVIERVSFASNTTSLDSIKKAAYRFIDQFSAEFVIEDSNIWCVLRFPPTKSKESIDFVVNDFRKEVLDQDLRASIRAETEPIRNLILAHAFSKTGLSQNE